jgi:hypothetical protein
MVIIDCLTREGLIRTFQYEKEHRRLLDRDEWIFRVFPLDKNAADWFEFTVTQIDEKTGKVTMMNNNNQPALSAKGIPERMIEEANKVLGLEIISSTNSPEAKVLDNEYITQDAVKVWQRLVKRGKALYDAEHKVFWYTP